MIDRIKSFIFYTSFAIAGIIACTLPSCKRDACANVNCANGGVCSGGACTCLAGYEGSQCETASRDKFLGTWNIYEKGNNTPAAQYSCSIEAGKNITDVYFNNFNDYFNAVYITGYVAGDTLWVPNQIAMGKFVTGLGTIVQNATYGQYDYMLFLYEVNDTATNSLDDYGYNASFDQSEASQWNK